MKQNVTSISEKIWSQAPLSTRRRARCSSFEIEAAWDRNALSPYFEADVLHFFFQG